MREIELIDSKEICERLSISNSYLTQLKKNSKDMPKPIEHGNGNSYLWKRKDMLAWINKQPKPGLDNKMALQFLKKLYAAK